jgi:hypothetical protein
MRHLVFQEPATCLEQGKGGQVGDRSQRSTIHTGSVGQRSQLGWLLAHRRLEQGNGISLGWPVATERGSAGKIATCRYRDEAAQQPVSRAGIDLECAVVQERSLGGTADSRLATCDWRFATRHYRMLRLAEERQPGVPLRPLPLQLG